MTFDTLFRFESELAKMTGAPYVIATDCCTHALELCFRYDMTVTCTFSAFTYISIPQLLRNLGITYSLSDEEWLGEYQFHGTRIWDSARLLRKGMYQPGQLQCLSFGHGKPLSLGKAGAILTDDPDAYHTLSRWRSDGRDLRISPWQDQDCFGPGWHYCPTLETCSNGIDFLPTTLQQPKYHPYPDLRKIVFDTQEKISYNIS